MSDLAPCSGCQRHVRVEETVCPFCGEGVAPVAARAVAAGRLTRAAVFAGAALATTAAGCGAKAKGPDNTGTGVGNTVADAGPGDEAPAPDAAPYVEPDHNIPMPYGAPPVRQRIV